MKRGTSSADVAWSFAALFLQFGAALLVLPAIVHFLTAEQLGMWYAFQLAGGLAMLLEFGYQTTFARNITYVANGASMLVAEGVPPHAGDGRSDPALMATLLTAMRRRYARIAAWIAGALLTAGTAYVLFISRSERLPAVLPVWILYTAFTACGFYLGHWLTFLTGLNRIREVQQLQIASRLVSIVAMIALLWLGQGLVGVVVGYGLGLVGAPVLARFIGRRAREYTEAAGVPERGDGRALQPILWHNARKSGEVAVGTFLVQRGSALIASAFLPLAEFASFSLTLQIVQVLAGIARVKLQISLPSLVAFAGRSELKDFRALFMSSLAMAWVIYLLGLAGLMLFGDRFIDTLGRSVRLVETPVIALLGLLYLFEITHGSCAWALTCFNTVPFVSATWLTGIAIAAASLFVGLFTDWGVMGFVLAQLACQLGYNAWKWPVELGIRCESGWGWRRAS